MPEVNGVVPGGEQELSELQLAYPTLEPVVASGERLIAGNERVIPGVVLFIASRELAISGLPHCFHPRAQDPLGCALTSEASLRWDEANLQLRVPSQRNRPLNRDCLGSTSSVFCPIEKGSHPDRSAAKWKDPAATDGARSHGPAGGRRRGVYSVIHGILRFRCVAFR